ESSGYDLAKAFDVNVSHFWAASPQQLYRELDRLEGEGLVSARTVEQERRPNKRVFTVTAAGREALRGFTQRAPKPTAIRDELLVQVAAVELGDPAAVRSHIAAKKAESQKKLARYDRSRERLLDGRSEEEYFAQEERIGPYLSLVRGILFEEENIRWGTKILSVLDSRQG
ncbi:MAG TPA: PadR family transcriptional regulator, partial [Brevibacterium sp.]|nr:PadR family transcriptional regulator [Brevibacterium sp.]